LPENFLMRKWSKKYILKEAFADVFPKGFLEKSKQGFGVPVGDWLRSNLKTELLSYIEVLFLKEQSIFDIKNITRLVDDHLTRKQDQTFKVWAFFCFQKWYKTTYLK